jgi:hypothetical protein
MSDSGDGGKVVPFAAPPGSLRIDRSYEARSCYHSHVEIRDKPRRLRCRDCKELIDPFEYIEDLAQRWETIFPKNEAARKLEATISETIKAHGSIIISDSGVTARRLTEQGQKLESH